MSPRPVPDEEIIKRALAVLEANETEMQAHVRTEYDAMIGCARIGMDAARKLWPIETDHMGADLSHAVGRCSELFADAYAILDEVSEVVGGSLLHRATLGEDITEDLLAAEKAHGIGPGAAAEAPAIP